MSTEWAVYDLATGQILGHLIAPVEQLSINVAAGTTVIEGHFDPLSQRVDLSTETVVDYQPPQPSPHYEWNSETKRWQLTASAAAALASAASAQADIDAHNLASIPLLRAALLDNDAAALTQLREINDSVENATAAVLKPAPMAATT